ncbi:glutathione S-transferase [Aliiglaciecola sp. 2_MG-2023]|uniref:glutathione S-transferase n=1 Tax=Alteromonadaceae TaxID=72275 RepID=UPI0026E31232|nr:MULTISPECIES: glutathione S-transferase [unclassified Aliiglaciecola]MDO6711974.1 glutathione S-transferase [Aliiglaciecola sp. 2_MG-2023]MDO6753052.1 glutathione S-transferase [Aliiglaciecola sp. 1_MG-2023]
MTLPILYSLRNCPYAMRARIALFKANQSVAVREVNLNNKPVEMLDASAKGTVPILVVGDELQPSLIVDESLEVMLWALAQNDPDDLLRKDDPVALPSMLSMIARFDDEFKTRLNAYKCAQRYRENNLTECRQACEIYIQELEGLLSVENAKKNTNKASYIMSDRESLVDIALLPFIRQFAKVERQWYQQSPYPNLKKWLKHYLQSVMFTKVMTKFEVWDASK